jgi:hypothetical protein
VAKTEREANAEKVRRKQLVESLMQHPGFALIKEELESVRKSVLRILSGDPESHARLARNGGKLDVLEHLIDFPDRVIREGIAAAKALNGKRSGDTSSESEDDGE